MIPTNSSHLTAKKRKKRSGQRFLYLFVFLGILDILCCNYLLGIARRRFLSYLESFCIAFDLVIVWHAKLLWINKFSNYFICLFNFPFFGPWIIRYVLVFVKFGIRIFMFSSILIDKYYHFLWDLICNICVD